MLSILKILWTYRRAVIPAILFMAFAGMAFLAHYRLGEARKAIAGRVIAERSLKVTQNVTAAQIDAMQKTMEETDERNQYLQNEKDRIAAERVHGDGPIAPVLRDTLVQLRARTAARHLRH